MAHRSHFGKEHTFRSKHDQIHSVRLQHDPQSPARILPCIHADAVDSEFDR